MDIVERPKTIPSLVPLYLYNHDSIPRSGAAFTNHSNSTASLSSSLSSMFFGDNLSQSLSSAAVTHHHDHLKKSSTSSVSGHCTEASFKGYTPTGRSKTVAGRGEGGGGRDYDGSESVSNMSALSQDSGEILLSIICPFIIKILIISTFYLSLSSFSLSLHKHIHPSLVLDPVFFKERARTSWGREEKLGKIRVRGDPAGYKRKMLTSLGHPGVYGSMNTGGMRLHNSPSA